MFKNLVFSGGGIKIFIFAGCLKYLFEHNLIDNLEAICGTSTGSILATGLALNYNISEITELLLKLDFSKFNNIDSEGILNFFDNFGLDNTNELERVFRIIIKAKVGNDDITFKELYEKTNKNLAITSTNLNKMETEFFDYKKTPDFKVIDAIICSISIPFIFSPKKLQDNYYIDGALTNHYPIEYFKDDLDNTLGFINVKNIDKTQEIKSLEEYLFAVSLCSMTKLIKNTINSYSENTIVIESEQNSIEFNLSIEKKYELINYGYELTSEFFKKRNKRSVSTDEDIDEEAQNIENIIENIIENNSNHKETQTENNSNHKETQTENIIENIIQDIPENNI
jgi:predicted acylesterase/phospholipase RssA